MKYLILVVLMLAGTQAKSQFLIQTFEPVEPCPGAQLLVAVTDTLGLTLDTAYTYVGTDTFICTIQFIDNCDTLAYPNLNCDTTKKVIALGLSSDLFLDTTVTLDFRDDTGGLLDNISFNTKDDDPNFTYNPGPGNKICAHLNRGFILPTIGNSTGTFTKVAGPAGVTLNTNTGRLNLNHSTGLIRIQYTTTLCGLINEERFQLVDSLDPGFGYGNSFFCKSSTGLSPAIMPTGLHVNQSKPELFTATPAGLHLNDSTGAILVDSSAPGLYQVTHTVYDACVSEATISILIESGAAGLSYPDSVICMSGPNPFPVWGIGSSPGGTFTPLNSRIVVAPQTGEILLQSSDSGTYQIRYDPPPGICSDPSFVTVTLTPPVQGQLLYSSIEYCTGDVQLEIPDTLITNSTSGTFLGLNGLTVDPLNGGFLPSAHFPIPNYGVMYVPDSVCESPSTFSFSLIHSDTLIIDYVGSPFCNQDADPIPFITGGSLGTFTSSDPAACPIDTNNGQIFLNQATPGFYEINYATQGNCAGLAQDSISIVAFSLDTFALDKTQYCTAESVIRTGPTGTGTFSAVPTGLDISPSGQISLGNSQPDSFLVIFTSSQFCTLGDTAPLYLGSSEQANLSYPFDTVCHTAPAFFPDSSGTSGGIFWSSNPTDCPVDPTRGILTPQLSVPGSYWIYYQTSSPTCSVIDSASIYIQAIEQKVFSYDQPLYCTGETASLNPPSDTGFYSFSPIGLSLNQNTGHLNPSNSLENTYQIIFHPFGFCTIGDSESVTIENQEFTNLSYPVDTVCTSNNFPIEPNSSGTAGGQFWSSDLVACPVDSGRGSIIPSNCSPGTYTLYYQTSNLNCGSIDSTTLYVQSVQYDSFAYDNTFYCSNETARLITPPSGQGTFSAVPQTGLDLNATTGVISLSTSNRNSYVITYTSNEFCTESNSVNLTLEYAETANLVLPHGIVCNSDQSFLPDSTGTPGGVFWSSDNTACPIDPTWGIIDPGICQPGSYWIYYQTSNSACFAIDSTEIIVQGIQHLTFNYNDTLYCSSEQAVLTPPNGPGTFTASPPGLSLASGTGQIYPNTSIADNYQVYFTPSGFCTVGDTQEVTIHTQEVANFIFSATTVCQTSLFPEEPVSSGTPGGTYWSSDLVNCPIDPQRGILTPNDCNPGNYELYYQTGNPYCSAIDTAILEVIEEKTLDFYYDSPVYCPGDTAILFLSDTTVNVRFSALPVGLSIHPFTGEINTLTSTPGRYTITADVLDACWIGSDTTIRMIQPDVAQIYFGDSLFCQNQNSPAPVIFGIQAGSFSSSPSGLVIDSTTGELDLLASTPSTTPYLITYTTPGSCPVFGFDEVYVIPAADATIGLPDSIMWQNQICQSWEQMTPSVVFNTNGIFSTPHSGLVFDPQTGEIDLEASATGTYRIKYEIEGFNGRCGDADSVTIQIVEPDAVTFFYDTTQSYLCTSGTGGAPVLLPDSLVGQPARFIWDTITGGPLYFLNQPGQVSFNGIIDLNGSHPGTYSIRFVDSSRACPIDTTLEVILHGPDPAFFQFPDSVFKFCKNEGYLFAEGMEWPGGWFETGVGLTLIDTVDGVVDPFTSGNGPRYITRYMDSLCPNSFVQEIEILATPFPDLSSPLDDYPEICAGDSLLIRNSVVPNGIEFAWELLNGNLPPNEITNENPEKDYLTTQLPPGYHEISVTATFNSGCAGRDTFYAQINQIPIANWIEIPEYVANRAAPSLAVGANLDSLSYEWVIDSFSYVVTENLQGWLAADEAGIGNFSLSDLVLLNPNAPGTIHLRVTPYAEGCEGEPITGKIIVLPKDQDPFVSQIISPNGDGQNDEWIFHSNTPGTLQTHTIELFNRLGAQVMPPTALDQSQALAGTINNLPDGIYWAILYDETNEAIWKGGIRIKRNNY